MQNGGVSEPPQELQLHLDHRGGKNRCQRCLRHGRVPSRAILCRNPSTVMMEERVPTAGSGRSSRPATQQRKPPPDWRISFGFWTELDMLYHSFPPPTKPRCPELPLDSTLEWYLQPDCIERRKQHSDAYPLHSDAGRSAWCPTTSINSWGTQRQQPAFARSRAASTPTLDLHSPTFSLAYVAPHWILLPCLLVVVSLHLLSLSSRAGTAPANRRLQAFCRKRYGPRQPSRLVGLHRSTPVNSRKNLGWLCSRSRDEHANKRIFQK
jgi:hypothetical protein